MKILGQRCTLCKDIVYSRVRHDMRWCSCGNIAVDGGFDYTKVSAVKEAPENMYIVVCATAQELLNDYLSGDDKYGLVKVKKARLSNRIKVRVKTNGKQIHQRAS